ncbi:MAG: hypothetical protein ACTMHL_06695 [Janibacter sp.]
MPTTSDTDQTVASWRRTIAAGEDVVIRQSRSHAVRYLLLVIGLTAVCAWVLVQDDGWWLRTGLMGAGIVFFGVIGVPVLVRQVIRGVDPVVRITPTTVSVGDDVLSRSEITWLRRHDGTYGEVRPERSGGVSVFRGQEHVLEIPLPPSVPTGAVERILLPGSPPPSR